MISACFKLDLGNLDDAIQHVNEDCLESLGRSGKDLKKDLQSILAIDTGALRDSIDTKEGVSNGIPHTVVGPRSDYSKVVGGVEVYPVAYMAAENELLGRWMQTRMDDNAILEDLAEDLTGTLAKRMQ